MEFEKRLKLAVERGTKRSEARYAESRQEELSQAELQKLHTKYRLDLSNHIEECIRKLPDFFPGFQFETIYGEKGWGAACRRDDVDIGPSRQRGNLYSRLEMTIRPFSDLSVLDLAAKGTIRNKEFFNRNHFEKIAEADPTRFTELIDLWVAEYAEQFAAKS